MTTLLRPLPVAVLAACCLHAVVRPAKNESAIRLPPVSLAVTSVSKATIGPNPRGVAALRLQNRSDSLVEYPLWCTHSKGSLYRVPLPLYKPRSGSTVWMIGAEFAEVRYEWRDPSGRLAVTGVYDVFTEPERGTLESRRASTIHVPMDLPSEPGQYVLSVQLENRTLEQCYYSYNYIRPGKKCFQLLEAIAAVVIPTSETQ